MNGDDAMQLCGDFGYYTSEGKPHNETYEYQCPKCKKGIIIVEKCNTPGFRCTDVFPCKNCGYKG